MVRLNNIFIILTLLTFNVMGQQYKINRHRYFLEINLGKVFSDQSLLASSYNQFIVGHHSFNDSPILTYGNHTLTSQEWETLQIIIEDFQVNENIGLNEATQPSVAMDAKGNFVVVWVDERNGDWDIYGQRYGADGTAIGENFRVNDDEEDSLQYSPSVAMDANGNFVVVWGDTRNDDSDIYGQQYRADGTVIGENFKVSVDESLANKDSPNIAMDAHGNFMVVWNEWEYSDWGFFTDIYGQRYGADGVAIGENFRVNDELYDDYQSYPSIAANAEGNFVVVWVSLGIWAQRYGVDGAAIGENFMVSDYDDSWGWLYQYYPRVAVDDKGNFVVVWEEDHYGNVDIYGQRYGSDGTAIGQNFRVNDDVGDSLQYSPNVAMDSKGNFVVVWGDNRNVDWDIYGQRYEADGMPIGRNFRINIETKKNQGAPDVQLWSEKIYTVWHSNHVEGRGYNIWANILDWSNPTGLEPQHNLTVDNFQLWQNYPNPFNSETIIHYQIPIKSWVKVKILSLSGEEIRTLVNRENQPGYFSVTWDAKDNSGRDVPSGIYLYIIRAENFSKTMKMILIR